MHIIPKIHLTRFLNLESKFCWYKNYSVEIVTTHMPGTNTFNSKQKYCWHHCHISVAFLRDSIFFFSVASLQERT